MKEKFPHYWICDACARERGGIWPEGHVATLALTECQYCNGDKHLSNEAIAPWVDYNWPDDRRADQKARLNRD